MSDNSYYSSDGYELRVGDFVEYHGSLIQRHGKYIVDGFEDEFLVRLRGDKDPSVLCTPSSTTLRDVHLCAKDGCKHVVAFDDEPYCYSCSPDSGSSVRGYSHKALRTSHN